MTVEIERLVVLLEASNAKYEKGMAKAQEVANRTAAEIERRLSGTEKRVSASFNKISVAAAGAFVTGAAIDKAKDLIDTSIRIQNSLKVAGLEGAKLTEVYGQLFESAQRNAAPLETLVQLYSRASLVQKELGVSSEELLKFTDNVALALRVAGTDAQTASGALLQLSQSLGSGTVRAEEFNSILEGALPIAQAAAAGLKEAGGSVAKLRQLVISGAISSQVFFKALEAGAGTLQDKVAGAELTISQSFVRLLNSLVDTAGSLNTTTGASQVLVAFLSGPLTQAVKEIGNVFEAVAKSQIVSFFTEINKGIEGAIALSADLGNKVGLNKIGEYFGATPYAPPKTDEQKSSPTPTVITPVSVKDFAAPIKAKSSSGGGTSRKNSFEREINQIKERTSVLNAETAAQAGLNPLIQDYGYQVDYAKSKAELLANAEKAGIKITPELSSKIDALATAYATASAESQKLNEAQDDLRQHTQELRDTGKDAFKGFVSDIKEGKSELEALAGALSRIGEKLLDLSIDSLFSKNGAFGGSGGGTGLFGGAIIPGILHSGGTAGSDGYGHGRSVSPSVFSGAPRYHNGGVAGLKPNEVPAILQKGELVIPRGGSRGGSFTYAPTIDARGATPDVLPLIRQALAENNKQLRANLPSILRDMQRRSQTR